MPFDNIFSFFTAIVISASLYPITIKIFERNNLIEKRHNRKIHKNEVATMGGIPLFIGFIITTYIWMPYQALGDLKYILSALTIIFIIGTRDDFISLNPSIKLITQLIPTIIIVYFQQLYFTSFYGIFGIYEIPIWLGYLVTIFTIIVITNAFNLIDGIDGLAGGVAITILAPLGIWFFLIGETLFPLLVFIALGSILPFLYFNWQPAKIFMGDTGALVLGFFISIMVIKFIVLNDSIEDGAIYKFRPAIATAVALLIIPLFDTARIFIIRVIHKRSPFKPDKNHIHHVLIRLGLSHAQATSIMLGINVLIVVLVLIFKNVSDSILVPVVIIICIALSLLLDYLVIKKNTQKKNKSGIVGFFNVMRHIKRASE